MRSENRLGRVLSLRGGAARAALAVAVVLACGALALGARSWLGSAARTAPQGPSVMTTLLATGFQPSETTQDTGRFVLRIENRSGVEGLSLQLTRDGGGGVVREFTVPSGTSTWNEELDLAAGGYLLREMNNPAWIYHITIE